MSFREPVRVERDRGRFVVSSAPEGEGVAVRELAVPDGLVVEVRR